MRRLLVLLAEHDATRFIRRWLGLSLELSLRHVVSLVRRLSLRQVLRLWHRLSVRHGLGRGDRRSLGHRLGLRHRVRLGLLSYLATRLSRADDHLGALLWLADRSLGGGLAAVVRL